MTFHSFSLLSVSSSCNFSFCVFEKVHVRIAHTCCYCMQAAYTIWQKTIRQYPFSIRAVCMHKHMHEHTHYGRKVSAWWGNVNERFVWYWHSFFLIVYFHLIFFWLELYSNAYICDGDNDAKSFTFIKYNKKKRRERDLNVGRKGRMKRNIIFSSPIWRVHPFITFTQKLPDSGIHLQKKYYKWNCFRQYSFFSAFLQTFVFSIRRRNVRIHKTEIFLFIVSHKKKEKKTRTDTVECPVSLKSFQLLIEK